jgi:hypothetical protein
MAKHLSAADFQSGIPIDSVELYMARFGGTVLVRELTSIQVALATRLGIIEVASSDGAVQIPDVMRRQMIQITLCLADVETGEPLFGDTPAAVLPHLETVERLGWRDHLLLMEVVERLTDGRLSEDERTFLAQEHTTLEQLDFLKLDGYTPGSILQAAESEDDVAGIYSVALHVPDIICGRYPMSVVRQLAAQIKMDRQELAGAIAVALATILNPAFEG